MHTGTKSCAWIYMQYFFVTVFRFDFLPGWGDQQVTDGELVKILFPVIDPVDVLGFVHFYCAGTDVHPLFQLIQGLLNGI